MTFTPGNDHVYNALPHVFDTDYVLELDLVNGHSHWTSMNGKSAIWHAVSGSNSYWVIGHPAQVGTLSVAMYKQSEDECVHDTNAEDWSYSHNNQWNLAGKGTFVECSTGNN